MEINCKEMKKYAISSLKGNWTVAILSAIVYSAIKIIGDFLPEQVNNWFTILSCISDALFIFGYTAIILHIVRGEKAEISEIFNGAKRFSKGLGMTLSVGILTLLWSLLLIVPGIIAAIKYSMTFYIWVDNPNIGISEAIDKSIDMINGHRWDVFKLYLSFIGWFLLVMALGVVAERLNYRHYIGIASVGMIPVSLYIDVAMATFYNKLLKERA